MAASLESVFQDGIAYALKKLGNPDRELTKEQYDAIGAICLDNKTITDCITNGFGKLLCYQVLPGMFDFMQSGDEQGDSIVIVVLPLDGLIQDQLQKLKECVNFFIKYCGGCSIVGYDPERCQQVQIAIWSSRGFCSQQNCSEAAQREGISQERESSR